MGWGREGAAPPAPSTARRMRTLAALLAAGAVLQLAAVTAPSGHSPCAAYVRPLLGDARFDQNYCRFVPELSDPVLNVRVTAAVFKRKLFGSGTTLTYEPYVGAPGGNIERRRLRLVASTPSFFWANDPSAAKFLLLGFYLTICVGGALALRRLLSGEERLLERPLALSSRRALAGDREAPGQAARADPDR
jgi:hypothetical protein